jgi:hypothetical protein
MRCTTGPRENTRSRRSSYDRRDGFGASLRTVDGPHAVAGRRVFRVDHKLCRMVSVSRVGKFVTRVFTDFSEKNVSFMAAGLADSAFVSLTPLLILMFLVLPLLGGALEPRIVEFANQWLPGPIADVVQQIFQQQSGIRSASVGGNRPGLGGAEDLPRPRYGPPGTYCRWFFSPVSSSRFSRCTTSSPTRTWACETSSRARSLPRSRGGVPGSLSGVPHVL